MQYTIVKCDPSTFEAAKDDLGTIIQACVAGGASVNFLLPFTLEQARAYWSTQSDAVVRGEIIVFLAVESESESDDVARRAVGCVVLRPAAQPNQAHRADIGKMLVHPYARRRGLGGLLLKAAEEEARRRGIWLLTLDTEAGGMAEGLYEKEGYKKAGAIPDFALLNDGKQYCAAMFMYKHLGRPQAA